MKPKGESAMITQSEMEQVLLRAKATGGDFAELFLKIEMIPEKSQTLPI